MTGYKIGTKIILLVTGVIVSMVTFVGVRVVIAERRGFAEALINKGESLARFMAKVAPGSILAFDVSTLDIYVKEIARDKDVLYATILNQEGAPISIYRSEGWKQRAGSERPAGDDRLSQDRVTDTTDRIEITEPITFQNQIIGTVRIGLSKQGLQERIKQQMVSMAAISLAGVLFSIFLIAVLISRSVVRPLRTGVAFATAVASGDMTRKVQVASRDELGLLSEALNRMVDDLRGILMRIQTSLNNVTATSNRLKETSQRLLDGAGIQLSAIDETSSSMTQISASLKSSNALADVLCRLSDETSDSIGGMTVSIQEVSKSILELTEAVHTTSSSIHEMSAAIQSIAETVTTVLKSAEGAASALSEISSTVKSVESHAKEATHLSKVVSQDASSLGLNAVERAIEGMSRIREEVSGSTRIIQDLVEKSERIGGVLTVINEVTAQTGLLALNAAIIAAQAGEHGKGFSVVADEIKQLAERTLSSTQEIAQIIDAIQGGIRNGIQAMNRVNLTVEQGVQISNETQAALKTMRESSDRSFQAVSAIDRAMAEQAIGIRQVDETVQKTTQMFRQIAQAIEDQRKGAGLIVSAAVKMQSVAEQVGQAMTEQAKGSGRINEAVQSVGQKTQAVLRTAKEQKIASDQIVQSLERIHSIAQRNTTASTDMDSSLSELLAAAEQLKNEIHRFKT